MPVIRGFAAAGIVACYDEAPGGGAMFDLNAPRNAPAKYPHLHLDKVTWHSEFEQFELVAAATVTIGHGSVSGRTGYTGFNNGVRMENQNSFTPTNGFWVIEEGQQTLTDHVLLTHSLGYVPLYYVAFNGAMLVDGQIVQDQGGSRIRSVAAFATTSVIGLREIANSSFAGSDLSAVSLSYEVMAFRSPTPNPSMPLFSKAGSTVTLGRGRVDTSKQSLRRVLSGESSFDLDRGRTVDVKNGGFRVNSGGNVADSALYNGSYGGSAYVPIGI